MGRIATGVLIAVGLALIVLTTSAVLGALGTLLAFIALVAIILVLTSEEPN